MPLVTLTEITLKHLAPVSGRQVIYLDKNGPKGFGVRVTEGGARSYVLTYGAKRQRVKLGDVGLIALSKAREKAKDILADRQLNGEASIEVMSFEKALRLFLTIRCAEKNKPSTAKETARLLNRHFLPVLKDQAVAKITTGDLMEITDSLLTAGTRSEANHAFTAARTLFRWLSKRRYIPHNPLDGSELPAKARSRDRVLSHQELPLILATAASQGSYGTMVECVFLTAQRDGQFAHLHRDFIDAQAQTITWPGRLMKSGREHTIPYTDRLARILDARSSPLLFPTQNDPNKPFSNWSNCKKRFDKELATKAPVPHWTLHDARRSFSTHAAQLGILPHITDLILDHSPIELSGVRGIYNKHRYLDEMRSTLLQYQTWIDTLTDAQG